MLDDTACEACASGEATPPRRRPSPGSAGAGRDDGERLVRALSAQEPFRNLDPQSIAEVARCVSLRRIPRGGILCRSGEPSDALFLVSSGRLQVHIEPLADPVAELAAGEPVGELAFLTAEPRTATVVAARETEVLEISRRSYEVLLLRAPGLQRMLLDRLARRMRRIAPAAQPLARTPARLIALYPIGDAGLPDGLVRRVAAALSPFGRIEILDGGAERAGGADLDDLLQRLEAECRIVLCPVHSPGTAAARQIVMHCDSLVLVARLADGGSAACVPGPAEREAHRLFLKRNRSLLLWRARESEAISGTQRWLQDRPVDLHHHLALDAPGDIARFARFAAGRAVGAVLGGGGALGCGHIGLVRAFRDAGLQFDMFGGTSAGAAMALAFATGIAPEELMDRTEEIFVTKRALRRFTLPVFSLLDHSVLDRELALHYGDRDIRDLPVNGYAISTNLTRNATQVHREGPLWQAVRSSGAIPGALPPFATADGELLADGALVDNLPVSTMRDLKLGPNVLAGFFEGDRAPRQVRYPLPGRARLVSDILLRRRRAFPGLLSVVARSMLVTSRRSLRETVIGEDLMVALPAVAGMGVFDWQLGRQQEEAAYRLVSGMIEAAGGAAQLIAAGTDAGTGGGAPGRPFPFPAPHVTHPRQLPEPIRPT